MMTEKTMVMKRAVEPSSTKTVVCSTSPRTTWPRPPPPPELDDGLAGSEVGTALVPEEKTMGKRKFQRPCEKAPLTCTFSEPALAPGSKLRTTATVEAVSSRSPNWLKATVPDRPSNTGTLVHHETAGADLHAARPRANTASYA